MMRIQKDTWTQIKTIQINIYQKKTNAIESNSCEQVNGGSQIMGQENTVTGFTNQSKNVQQPSEATKPQQTGLTPVIPSDKAIPQSKFPSRSSKR